MAAQRIYDRWSPAWTILADSGYDSTDVADDFPDAPVGSKLIVAGSSAVPTEYVKFPSGWVQTTNFAST